MKKTYLHIFILLCSGFSTKAQMPPSYLNIKNGINNLQDFTSKIIKFDSNYYGLSTAAWPNIEPKITLTKYDGLLNIVNSKTIGFSNKALLCFIGQHLQVRTTDSTFFITGLINQDFFGNKQINGMLWKLNKNLDTLWHKSYANINDSSIIFEGSILENNGLLLYGQSTEFDWHGDAFIMKVDFNGNELWRKTIPVANRFGGISKLIKTKDNSYVATENLLDYPSTWFSDIQITKFDTAFNIKWQRILYTPYYDYLGDIIEVSDSNLVLSQGYCISQINAPIGSLYNRQCLTKINNKTSATIWQKLYGKVGVDIQLHNILETPSKKIMALGNITTAYVSKPSGTYISSMLVTNQFGDSLNYQETFSDSLSKMNHLLDLVPTTNGYYCVGSSQLPIFTGTVLSGYEQQNWLVKADTNGCFNPNCVLDVGVQNLAENLPKNNVSLYPNPSSGNTNLYLSKNTSLVNAEVVIIDITGKVVLTQPLNKDNAIHVLLTQGFARGLYLVTILTEGKVIYKQKLIIEY